MKIYYTGILMDSDVTKNSDFFVSYHADIDDPMDDDNENLNLKQSDFNYYQNILIWRNVTTGITDTKLLKIIDKADFEYYFENNNKLKKIIFEIIENEDGNLYGKEYITGLLFPLRDENENQKVVYECDEDENHKITIQLKFTDDNLAKFKIVLLINDVANINEIENYKNKYKTKWAKEKIRKKLLKIYNENVFKKEIIEKKDKIFETQSELTKIMEDIEYLLSILKSKDEVTYKRYSEKYNNIMNSKYFDDKLLKKELLKLTSEIKLTSMIINSTNLEEYLNNSVKNYLDKLLNNITTIEEISIYDLDKINELFLKYKDIYDIQYQRNILKKISLLYLLIVKNNIDNFSEKDFNESYFKHNLKSIILNISILGDLGIINNNKTIDISIEPNISNILNIIKKIEFNSYNEEHIKKLIK